MKFPSAPTIETARLCLRAARVSDFDAYAAMWAQPEVTRHIGGRPLAREDAWARLLRSAGQWPLMGYGFWIVEEKESDRFAGTLGFQEVRRGMRPSIEGIPEVGWAFAPASQGRGLAAEALAAILAWGDAQIEASETACIIEPAHVRSIALAARLGFRAHGSSDYGGTELTIYRRPRGG